MTNSAQSFPVIEIQCKDRKREFCLNLEAFRVLQEHKRQETGNDKFKILTDLDWSEVDGDIELITLLLWGGLHRDARINDSEIWTLEKAAEVVDMIGVSQAKMVFVESFRRAMTPEDFDQTFSEIEAEKKMKPQAKKRKRGRPKKKMT